MRSTVSATSSSTRSETARARDSFMAPSKPRSSRLARWLPIRATGIQALSEAAALRQCEGVSAHLPAPVEPPPLARMLADPLFHHIIEQLGHARHIDRAIFIARQLQLFHDLEPVAPARQADAPCRIDVAVILPGEFGHERVGEARPVEEGRPYAPPELLVHQRADIAAAFQDPG